MRVSLTRITAILRGYNTNEVLKICEVLRATQEIRNVEITLNTENAYEIIATVAQQFGNELNIGAGTVMTLEQGIQAHQSGAEFFLSPTVMSCELSAFAKEKDILTVSGAFSATEVRQAVNQGADIVKIFPVTSLKDSYFKDIKAPLGNIPLMAVGGVNQQNAANYLANGADYLGVGSLFGQADIMTTDMNMLIDQALEFEKSLNIGEKNNGRIR